MPERPYTLLSCSVSLDGYLGDQTPRLALSNEADFDRVDEVRASCDAIMVGAVTVRTDNPRLLVLLAAALPNIGGWGPREGMTAWAFAAAGLGASLGVATAVVYGVMVLVASLPGAAVLVVVWMRRTRPAPWIERPLPARLGIAHRDGAGDA